MWSKDADPGGGLGRGLAILAIGVAIGLLARPSRWLPPARQIPDDQTSRGRRELSPLLAPAAGTPAPAANGLRTLAIELPEDSAAALQEARDRAHELGAIVRREGDRVPATVRLGGPCLAARVRLKGDWLDHVRDDRWSLRIELSGGKLLGMRVFSIQAPRTRGFLWEWLVLAAGRREGLLAPRGTFVNVVLNGNPAGVYYLEEHFAKELLESQGRREGPIVRWDESTHWRTLVHANAPGGLLPPPETLRGTLVESAEVRAYDEDRLTSIDSLRRQLLDAVEDMRAVRALARRSWRPADRIAALQDLEALEGRTVEELLDVHELARAHALLSLMQVAHGLQWHQLRFYHDPLADRLEPVLFDNMAHVPSSRAPVPLRGDPLVRGFARSNAYYDGVFEDLAAMCAPGWLDALFDELGAELARYEAALLAEGTLPPDATVAAMRQRLRAEQTHLLRVLAPADPLNACAVFERREEEGPLVKGEVEVRAWSTTAIPVEVEGFRFGDGRLLPAATALVADGARASARDGSVVLPHDGSRATFRFEADQRLASLRGVRELERAAREGTELGAPELEIDLEFRSPCDRGTRRERLRVRPASPATRLSRGRPPAPTLEAALQRHPFLDAVLETGELVVHPGTWEVRGDLVVPPGLALRLPPGTTLRFRPGACLLSETALRMEGGPEAPVVLEPAVEGGSWGGVLVLDAGEASEWNHVVVRGTAALARAGWETTGGITLYHSALRMRDCLLERSAAEDALNVFGTSLELLRVTLRDCASDGIDGDFVTGRIADCTIERCASDGVDLSGSDVELVGCVVRDVGDKALSLGEESRVRVSGGRLERCSIGVAAKDGSTVSVRGTTVSDARHFALAAFQKKPEFGPATLLAEGLELHRAGAAALCQTGSRLELEGVAVPGVELDVERLYAEGVLGR